MTAGVGKLAALISAVTPISESPAIADPTARTHEGPLVETSAFIALRLQVAQQLEEQAPEIAVRWERQSRSVSLRAVPDSPSDAGVGRQAIEVLVRSLAASLASDGATADDAVALGLAHGVDAFEQRASLHHTLKGLDLLTAMMLYAVEHAVSGEAGTVGDGVRLCRRLQQSTSLLSLAVAKGYTQAMSDGLRDRFRLLRHDLRNPLGTIKSVLALMDDETVPADARSHPRFRAMAERNARSLDELIVDRLSDAAALLPALSHQRVSLRMIACGVRRDLRAEAESRDVSVLVADVRTRACVDAVSLELLLHALLYAALQEAQEGDELVIGIGGEDRDRATVVLSRMPASPAIADVAALDRLAALAARMGARLTVEQAITVSVPIRDDEE